MGFVPAFLQGAAGTGVRYCYPYLEKTSSIELKLLHQSRGLDTPVGGEGRAVCRQSEVSWPREGLPLCRQVPARLGSAGRLPAAGAPGLPHLAPRLVNCHPSVSQTRAVTLGSCDPHPKRLGSSRGGRGGVRRWGAGLPTRSRGELPTHSRGEPAPA